MLSWKFFPSDHQGDSSIKDLLRFWDRYAILYHQLLVETASWISCITKGTQVDWYNMFSYNSQWYEDVSLSEKHDWPCFMVFST